MGLPETRYARSGELNIAYQVLGDGPFDLVFVPGFISHLDLQWMEPLAHGFFERLFLGRSSLTSRSHRPLSRRRRRTRARPDNKVDLPRDTPAAAS